MKKFALSIAGLLLLTFSAIGQNQGVAINSTGAAPHASAMLDVSSTTRGMLIPRMTFLQRTGITTPATGLLVYQTNLATGFYVYNGSAWEQIWAGNISIDDLSDAIVTGNSVYLGALAGVNDDGTNNYNVGIGTQASNHNIKGYFNVAVGYQSLFNDTSSWNTAIGYQAFYSNTQGNMNTGLGFRSAYYNTTGKYNTVLGYNANFYNQTGSNNTILGFQAGFGGSGVNKSGNILIGYQAGYNETGSNKLYIENSNIATPLIYGEFDTDLLRVNGTLHIGTAYHFPVTDGTSGQVLATDGSGTVGWTTVTSSGGPIAINDLTDAKTGGNSVFLGADAGAADLGTDNRQTAVGIGALNANADGNYNTALGYRAAYYNATGNYNILLGPFADRYNSGGSQNVIIGYLAGGTTTSHSKSGNIHIGYQAGYSNTTDNKLFIENSSSNTPLIWGDFAADSVRINGDLIVTGLLHGNIGIDDLNDGKAISSSVFLGDNAGNADDGTDNKNVALGYQALQSSTGENNIAIGQLAAENNVTGNYNIAIGTQANGNNTGGEKNVMIGYGAGYKTTAHNKTGNIFIGYAAGFNAATDNKLYIENSSSSTPLIWGDFTTDSVMINGDFGITGNWVGIGIDDLEDGKADSYNLFLGNGAGQNNDPGAQYSTGIGQHALEYNTSGICNTASGYMSLYANLSGNQNTAMGYYSMKYNTFGFHNTAVGDSALYTNDSGDRNTAIGAHSLRDNYNTNNNTAVGYCALANNESSHITAVGDSALYNNTYGQRNAAMGSKALSKNTIGDDNAAFGYQALLWNTAGNNNTAIGSEALYNNYGDNNTASGYHSLYSNLSGSQNTAMGYYSMKYNTFGFHNTAVGDSALYTNDSGDRNTAIGAHSLRDNFNTNNNTAVGYGALANCESSHLTAVGDSALYNNTYGQRNAAMGSKALSNNSNGHDNSAFGYQTLIWNTTGDNNTAVGTYSGPGQAYPDLNNTVALGYAIGVTASNYVKIGNTSQTWIGGQVTWSTYSDERMKENIREDVKGLDFIMKLRPVTYHVNKDNIDGIMGVLDKSDYPEKYDIEKITQSGFLAQEVEQAAVESGYDFSGIHAPVNEHTPYSISYSEFVVPLVKAMQEQQELIQELRQEIEELKAAARAE